MAQLEQMFRKKGSRVGYLEELWPSRLFRKRWSRVGYLEKLWPSRLFRKRGSRVGYLEELWPSWNRCLGKGGAGLDIWRSYGPVGCLGKVRRKNIQK